MLALVHELDVQYNVLIDADCILVSSNDAYANDAVRQPNATMLALCTDTFVMFAQCKEAWVHPKQVMLVLYIDTFVILA
jgi:hypothetical protein